MTTDKSVSRIASFVDRRINQLKGRKSQKDIAEEAGFVNHNMITQIKLGASKVSLDRVSALAKALECDPAHLFRLALEQYYSKATIAALSKFSGEVVTENEREFLTFIRQTSHDSDPKLSPKIRTAINTAIKS